MGEIIIAGAGVSGLTAAINLKLAGLLVRRFARDPDLNALVSRWYHPRRIHRLLSPLVERQFRREVAAVSGNERYRNRTRQTVGV